MVGLCEPEDTAAALAAVASNQISLLQTYLASGVDVNAFHAEQSSGQQRTLLHVAAFHGCVEVLEYLLGAGADPNIQSPSDACSPLHAACEGASARCYEAIELLLKAGANKEATDQRGRQPIDLLLTTANPGSDAPVEPAQGSCGMHVPREGDEPASSELNKPEYCTDEARMYMFKVADCPHMDPHDWTECPFAHPGEKARRRDPKCYLYTGVACPDFRKGACKRGDRCPFAHGVFECWLHPSRYRTQLCKDAPHCERRVCFFAHQLDELRTPAAADTNLLAAALAIQSGRDAEGAGGGAAAAAAKDEDQGAPSCADKQSSSCGGTPRGPTSPAAPGSSASTPGGSPCANSCGNPAFGGAAAAAGAGAGAPGRAPTAKERALAAITGAAPYKPSPKLAALLAIGGIESELLASLTAAATRANSAASASSDKSPVRGSSSAASTPLQTSSSGGSSASGKRGSGKSSAASTDTDSPGAPQGRGARGRGQRQQQGAGAHGQRGHGASRMLQQQVLQQQQQQRLMQYYATAAATANAAATMAQYREQIQQQQAVLAALQQQQQQMLLSQAAGTSPFGAAAGAGSPWGSSSGLNDMLGMTSAAQDLVLQQQQQQHMGANAAAEALANLQLQSLGLPGGRNGLGSGPFPTSPTSAAAAAAAAAAVSMASRAGSLPAPGGSLGMLGGFSGALPDVLGGGVSASGPLSMLDGGCSSGDWMAPHQALALSRPQLMSGLGMPQGGSYLPNNLGGGGGYTLGNPYAHQMAGGGGLGGMRGGAGGGMGDAGGDWGSNGTWGPGGPLPVGAT